MNKTKLAICMSDCKYQERFVRCLMNHYKEQYEIYVYEEIESLEDAIDMVVITEGLEADVLKNIVKHYKKVLVLQEDLAEEKVSEDLLYVNKYQEVYRIIDHLEKNIDPNVTKAATGTFLNGAYEMIGVISFSNELLQLPFSATTAMVCGEKEKVLLMDLQPFSGLAEIENLEESESLGMEDLMSIATTGIYTPSRLLGAIGQEQKWDYVQPVKNTECLVEANADIYTQMMNLLVKELGYKKIVVNFGVVFFGMFELMSRCDQMFCVTHKGEGRSWREQVFLDEIKRRGKEDLWKRVSKIEVPPANNNDKEWRVQAQAWLWTAVGDALRERLWVESHVG